MNNKVHKYLWVLLSIATILTLSGWFFLHKKTSSPFEMEVINTQKGYGYDILYNQKRIITQETIPALPGVRTFSDSLSAAKVGNLVVQKLNNMESPSVTIDELTAIGIK